MDGFGWFGIERLGELCTPRMATVLSEALDGGRLFDSLQPEPPARLALSSVPALRRITA